MSIIYRKRQNKIANSTAFNKWYGKAVILDTISTKDLAQEISHSTTVTYADVVAVLIEMQTALKSHLQNSQKVQLDGLGSFRVGIVSKSADTREKFTVNNIKSYRIIFQPETKFVPSGVLTAKGNRKGTFVKTLLEGISAKEMTGKDAEAAPAETGE